MFKDVVNLYVYRELQIGHGVCYPESTNKIMKIQKNDLLLFSSPGRSPGRAIVLPPALASASVLAKC